MEFETEIIVVIIASVASLIVGVINIIFNAKISAKQNEIELKKTRIELLETRRQKIEAVKSEISNRVIDLSDVQDFVFERHFPRMMDFFQIILIKLSSPYLILIMKDIMFGII